MVYLIILPLCTLSINQHSSAELCPALAPHRYQFSLAVPKVSIGRLINSNFGSVLGMFDWPPGTIQQF